MDTREVLIVNPTSSNQVDPDYAESEKRLEKWYSKNQSKTIIATGFIASTPENIPTTLKRDGSDFSAAIMGALFRAGQVTIWTDVNGVYSADPRKGLFIHFDMLTAWTTMSHLIYVYKTVYTCIGLFGGHLFRMIYSSWCSVLFNAERYIFCS